LLKEGNAVVVIICFRDDFERHFFAAPFWQGNATTIALFN
jgi:hypothetical protein